MDASNPMTATRGGIICTASNAGLYSFPIAPIYATTKHGVVGLVRSLARPLALAKIQINALAPAVVGMLLHYAVAMLPMWAIAGST